MIEQKSNATEQEKKVASDKLAQLLDFFKEGKSFDELVRYSDDKGSSKQGGELPWFSTGQMVSEFEEAAFALEKQGRSFSTYTNYLRMAYPKTNR